MSVDAPLPPTPPAPDTPPAPAPPVQPDAPAPVAADTPAPPAPPLFALDPDLGPTLSGVPLFVTDNPYGGYGLGVLVGLDLDAQHEVGQKRRIPDTDPPEYEPVPKSGGSAYYTDLLGGHGWTVPLNPEGA